MKKLNYVMIFLFIVIDIWYVYDQLSLQNTSRLACAFAVIPVLLVPFVVKKVLRYEMNDTLKFVYYLFAFCCVILGSVLNLYNRPATQGFDKITHFISGLLTSLIALIILKHSKLRNNSVWFNILFMLLFSVAIGAVWEYFEYAFDTLLKDNLQHVETGVTDTMLDMIVATFASVLFSIYYYLESKKKNNHIEKMLKTL